MKTFRTFLTFSFIIIFQINLHAQTITKMASNKAVATRFYSEVINKGDSVAMHLIMAENFIDHFALPNQPKGIEGFKQFLTMVTTGFPDIQVKVEDMINEGDKVVVRLTISGTQTGVLMGNIPPSGKQATWTGIDILKIENGIITERWSHRDMLGMMKQIGAIK